jgi:hypothetical protein
MYLQSPQYLDTKFSWWTLQWYKRLGFFRCFFSKETKLPVMEGKPSAHTFWQVYPVQAQICPLFSTSKQSIPQVWAFAWMTDKNSSLTICAVPQNILTVKLMSYLLRIKSKTKTFTALHLSSQDWKQIFWQIFYSSGTSNIRTVVFLILQQSSYFDRVNFPNIVLSKQDANYHKNILSNAWVTIDGVWIGGWIYWLLTVCKYKKL